MEIKIYPPISLTLLVHKKKEIEAGITSVCYGDHEKRLKTNVHDTVIPNKKSENSSNKKIYLSLPFKL